MIYKIKIQGAREFRCFIHSETVISAAGRYPNCFKLTLNPASAPGERIEIMLHARSLVDLIHKCSVALCEWQSQTSAHLIEVLSDEARKRGPG